MMLKQKPPKVTIVIPTDRNGRENLARTLRTLNKSTYRNFSTIVVDDASTDDTCQYVRRHFPKVRILKSSKKIGTVGAKNIGIRSVPKDTDYILFLDNDIAIERRALANLVRAINGNDEYGAATGKILYRDNPKQVQYCGASVGLISSINYSNSGMDGEKFRKNLITQCAGGAVLVKRAVVRRVGSFDTAFAPVYYEDADYSIRINKSGYKILCVASARFYHNAPSDRATATQRWLSTAYLTARNKLIFMKKHSTAPWLFLFIYPIFPAFYFFQAIKYRHFDALRNYVLGIRDGLRYIAA